MDPLSVTASVAGLIQLADAVFSKTFQYVKAVRGAEKEIAKLSAEVGSLSGTLHSLELLVNQLEDESFSTTIRASHIYSCQKTLEKIEKKLIAATPAIAGSRDKVLESIRHKLKWPFTASEVKEYLAEIERHKSTFTLALTAGNMSTLLQCLSKGIASDIEEIKFELKRRRTFETRIAIDKERQAILDFFGSVDPTAQHRMFLKTRYPTTGVWLTEGDTFLDWLQQTDNSAKLWLYGIPGAGKTILAASVIEEAANQSSPTKAVAFFYCDYNDKQRQDPVHILGSIAAQLARQDERGFDILQTAYTACQPKGGGKPVPPDPEELLKLIQEIADLFETVSVIVDAIDECDANTIAVTELLLRLGQHHHVKTLFVSRPETSIQKILEADYTKISIAAQSDDIKLYVAAEMELRTRKKTLRIRNPDLKVHIMDTLVSKAQGMFRWVTCQIDYLCELPTDTERRNALNELPPTLTSSYERILERVNNRNPKIQQLVQNALQWIVCSRGALSMDELCEALSVHEGAQSFDPDGRPDEEEVMSCCSSLLRESADSRGLELAHFTVKEFLTSIPADSPLAPYRIEQQAVETELAKTCLTYLNLKEFSAYLPRDEDELQLRMSTFKFLNHAVSSWHHYASTSAHWEDAALLGLAKRLFHPSKTANFLNWSQSFAWQGLSPDDSKPPSFFSALTRIATRRGVTPLHYAALLGLVELSSWLVESNPVALNQASAFGTPLHCAIVREQQIVASITFVSEKLLENARRRMDNRDQDLIEGLMDAGADCTLLFKDGMGGKFSCLFMMIATRGLQSNAINIIAKMLSAGCEFGEDSMAILRRRLEDRIVSHRNDKMANGSMSTAGGLGDLANEGDVNQQLTDLFMSMARSVPGTAKKLNVKLGHVGYDDSSGSKSEHQTLLYQAALCDQPDVIRELISNKKVDINQTNRDGETALHLAAANASARTVQMLLDAGGDLMATDDRGHYPLHLSAYNQDPEVIMLLFDKYEDKNLLDRQGRSLWHIAAAQGNVEVLNALLDSIDDVSTALAQRTRKGYTPMLSAARQGKEEALMLLLDYCNDINETSDAGENAIHLAVGVCSSKAIERLIKIGIKLDVATKEQSNALHFVMDVAEFPFSVFETLMKHNTPNVPRRDGKYPLHLAMTNQLLDPQTQCKVIEQLATPEIINAQDSSGRTALHYLLTGPVKIDTDDWRVDVLQCMLKQGADLSIPDHFGREPLQMLWRCLEVPSPKKDITDLVFNLADIAIDYVTKDHLLYQPTEGRTPLSRAIEYCSEGVATKLLNRGVNPNLRDTVMGSYSAIDVACWYRISPTLFSLVLDKATTLMDPKFNDFCPIHTACMLKSSMTAEKLGLLLDRGVPIDCQTGKDKMTPLMIAVRGCRVELAEVLIKRGASFSIDDITLWKPLHFAAYNGCADILPMFREHGADLSCLVNDKLGSWRLTDMNSLHLAAQNGHENVIKYFLENNIGLDVDSRTWEGDTPLHLAAAFGQRSCAEFLLSKGADITARSKNGFNALHRAVTGDHVSTVRLLLANGCPQVEDSNGQTPEHIALRRGFGTIVNLLRDEASKDSHKSSTPNEAEDKSTGKVSALSIAVEAGDLAMCQREVERGVNISVGLDGCPGCSPLLVSLALPKLAITRYLLEQGAPTTGRSCSKFCAENRSAVHLAATHSSAIDILRSMLRDVNPSSDPYFNFPSHPIHEAVITDNVDGLRALLDHFGVPERPDRHSAVANKPEYLDYPPDAAALYKVSESHPLLERVAEGMTLEWSKKKKYDNYVCRPIHLAVANKSTRCARLLLERGASIHARDDCRRTALHLAVWKENEEMFKLCLEFGANVNLADSSSNTPAAYAVKKGNLDMLEELYRKGADLNVGDLSCKTLLEHAVGKQPGLVQFLLDKRCDFKRTNRFGRTFLAYVFTEGSAKVRAMVANYGLDIRGLILSGHNPLIFDLNPPELKDVKPAVKLMPPDLVGRLLNERGNNSHRNTLLYSAAFHGEVDVLEFLLKAGADTEAEGGPEGTPLMAACATGSLSTVRLLIRAGARLLYRDAKGQDVSAVVAARYHPHVVHWLLVDQYNSQRLITDGQDCDERPTQPWSGLHRLKLADLSDAYAQRYDESMLRYLSGLYRKKQELFGRVVPYATLATSTPT